MKRIRILGFVSGTLNGAPVVPGAEFDLPDAVAAEYVNTEWANGKRLAEYVDVPEPETTDDEPQPEPETASAETASVEPPENAAKRTGRPKGRKKA